MLFRRRIRRLDVPSHQKPNNRSVVFRPNSPSPDISCTARKLTHAHVFVTIDSGPDLTSTLQANGFFHSQTDEEGHLWFFGRQLKLDATEVEQRRPHNAYPSSEAHLTFYLAPQDEKRAFAKEDRQHLVPYMSIR